MNKMPNKLFESMRPGFAEELGVPRDFDTAVPLLVVTGQNAAGKSLLRRWFQMVLRDKKVEAIHLSMQGRAEAGPIRAFLYGSESDEATGAITCNTFLGAIRTTRARENDHVILWDEPEIGMGEEVQLGTADWLCEQLSDWPDNLRGVIMLTHSRYFVQRMMEFPEAKWLSLDGYETAQDWLNRTIVPVGPEEVKERGVEKWRRINKLLKRKGKS